MARIAVLALCAWAVCSSAVCMGRAAAAELRVAVPALPSHPGDPYASVAPDAIRTALFDALTRFDKDGNLAPALAQRWKSEAPTRWRFVLRRDVVFSNGEPFTAAAVEAAFAWLKTPQGKATAVGGVLPPVTATVEDDYVVVLQTGQPDADLPRRVAGVMIVAPQAWSDVGPQSYVQAPVTTGPFKITRWSGEGATFTANQASWRPPRVNRVEMKVIPDTAERARMVASGRADIALALAPQTMDLLDKANVLAAVTPAMAVTALAFRLEPGRKTPLRDARVRVALNHALDRTALSRGALRGLGLPAGQPAARDVEGYDPQIKAHTYDPAKAKALLAEAGYADGLNIHAAVRDDDDGRRALYDAVAEQLAKVGVTLTITTLSPDDWRAALENGEWSDDVDAFSMPFDAAPGNDLVSALAPWSCLKLVPFVCDQALTARLTAARETTGVDRRAALLGDLARTYHDDPPALYLFDGFHVFGVARGVDGFTVVDGIPLYETMSVKP